MYQVGADIGGTFTDCVVIDEQGRATTAKPPPVPQGFSQGMIDAIGPATEKLGYFLNDRRSGGFL
jgi:N-methylhydantoinase A